MRLTILFVLIGTLALTGCGGPSEEEEKAAVDARAKAERNRDIADKALAVSESCRGQLSGYLGALTETNSRLDVGMSFADYGSQVGDNSVEYDQIPFRKMDNACVMGPGIAAEKAGNATRNSKSNGFGRRHRSESPGKGSRLSRSELKKPKRRR
jgi:hypothetical protein